MHPEPIRYYSTNHGVEPVTLREALLAGQAADRGLFMPERLPTLTAADLVELASRPYPQVAFEVLRRFTVGMMDDARLAELCADAYSYDVPLEQVAGGPGRLYLMRLDQGPTASFKDFAARMMARWMGHILAGDQQELVILTATSGDTGSAVAHAYYGVPGIRIVVLFPLAEVSNRQRRQMTTLGKNVTTHGVDGKFDDCQAMVKRAFADPALSGIRLSSANSINIGRLLPQAVYYVYAYSRLARGGEPIVVSVPSGNFGDMMGSVLALRMGLPIERVIIATNSNDEVPKFVETGRYEKIVPSRVCLSNAMNVGHPSNLARLVDVYGGQMDETGALRRLPDMAAMRRDLWSVSIDDAQTRATIKQAYERHRVVLEPHGAVGFAGLWRYLDAHPDATGKLLVSVETAHPAKFPEEIQALLGLDPPVPPALAGLEERREHYGKLTTDYELFRDLLLREFGGR
jgi:threonine synthase